MDEVTKIGLDATDANTAINKFSQNIKYMGEATAKHCYNAGIAFDTLGKSITKLDLLGNVLQLTMEGQNKATGELIKTTTKWVNQAEGTVTITKEVTNNLQKQKQATYDLIDAQKAIRDEIAKTNQSVLEARLADGKARIEEELRLQQKVKELKEAAAIGIALNQKEAEAQEAAALKERLSVSDAQKAIRDEIAKTNQSVLEARLAEGKVRIEQGIRLKEKIEELKEAAAIGNELNQKEAEAQEAAALKERLSVSDAQKKIRDELLETASLQARTQAEEARTLAANQAAMREMLDATATKAREDDAKTVNDFEKSQAKMRQSFIDTSYEGKKASSGILLSWQTMGRLLTIQFIHTFIRAAIYGLRQLAEDSIAYQTRLSEVQTINQGTSFGDLAAGTRQISLNSGFGLTDVTEGLYQTTSNQIAQGLDAISHLSQVATFARTTASSMKDSIQLIDGVLNAYGRDATETSNISAQLFEVIKLGRVRADELAESIGPLTTLSSELGISLSEVGASIATLTIQGNKFSNTSTYLQNFMARLIKPTGEMKDLLKSWGYETGQQAIAGLGFTGVLQKMAKEVGNNTEKYSELVPTIRGLKAVLGITKDMDEYQQRLEAIANGYLDYAKAQKIAVESPGFEVGKEFEKIKTFFVTDLGGSAIDYISDFSKAVGGLEKFIESLTNKVITLGVAFGVYKLGSKSGKLFTEAFTQGNYLKQLRSNSQILWESQLNGTIPKLKAIEVQSQISMRGIQQFGRNIVSGISSIISSINWPALAFAATAYLITSYSEWKEKLKTIQAETTANAIAQYQRDTEEFEKAQSAKTDIMTASIDKQYEAVFQGLAAQNVAYTNSLTDLEDKAQEINERVKDTYQNVLKGIEDQINKIKSSITEATDAIKELDQYKEASARVSENKQFDAAFKAATPNDKIQILSAEINKLQNAAKSDYAKIANQNDSNIIKQLTEDAHDKLQEARSRIDELANYQSKQQEDKANYEKELNDSVANHDKDLEEANLRNQLRTLETVHSKKKDNQVEIDAIRQQLGNKGPSEHVSHLQDLLAGTASHFVNTNTFNPNAIESQGDAGVRAKQEAIIKGAQANKDAYAAILQQAEDAEKDLEHFENKSGPYAKILDVLNTPNASKIEKADAQGLAEQVRQQYKQEVDKLQNIALQSGAFTNQKELDKFIKDSTDKAQSLYDIAFTEISKKVSSSIVDRLEQLRDQQKSIIDDINKDIDEINKKVGDSSNGIIGALTNSSSAIGGGLRGFFHGQTSSTASIPIESIPDEVTKAFSGINKLIHPDVYYQNVPNGQQLLEKYGLTPTGNGVGYSPSTQIKRIQDSLDAFTQAQKDIANYYTKQAEFNEAIEKKKKDPTFNTDAYQQDLDKAKGIFNKIDNNKIIEDYKRNVLGTLNALSLLNPNTQVGTDEKDNPRTAQQLKEIIGDGSKQIIDMMKEVLEGPKKQQDVNDQITAMNKGLEQFGTEIPQNTVALRQVRDRLESLTKTLETYTKNPSIIVPAHAMGVTGSDTNLAMLTPGESVITREATQSFYPLINAMNGISNVSQTSSVNFGDINVNLTGTNNSVMDARAIASELRVLTRQGLYS